MPAAPDHVAVRLVGEDHQRRVPRTTSAIAARSASVATPPVGLWGEFRKIARGFGSVARNRAHVLGPRAECFSARSGTMTGRAPRRCMFGT